MPDGEPAQLTVEELDQVRAAFVDLGAGDDEGAAEKLAQTDSSLIDAFVAMSGGMSDLLARSGDRAAEHFADAAAEFDRQPRNARRLHVLSLCRPTMRGECMRWPGAWNVNIVFDFTGAASAYIEAMARLQDLADNRLPAFASEEDDDDAKGVLQRLQQDVDAELLAVEAAGSETIYQSAMAEETIRLRIPRRRKRRNDSRFLARLQLPLRINALRLKCRWLKETWI